MTVGRRRGPRSASRTSAWYSRSAASPASASRVRPAVRRRGGVVLGGEQHLGGLLGDLAAGRVDAAVEQRRRVGAGRALGGAVRRSSTRASRARRSPGSSRSAGRAVAGRSSDRVPRWQVGPTGSTVTSRASPSQSSARSTSRRTLPLVSPLRQSRSREREWKWTSPVSSVAASASASIQAEHQDPAVGRVLDDRGDEAVRAEARPSGRSARASGRHATASRRPAGPDRPAAAIAALTVGDRVDPAMEDRGREHRVGAAVARPPRRSRPARRRRPRR